MKRVSILGLGSMGSTLAKLLLEKNFEVHVWNRTAGKTETLVEKGAIVAANAADAISKSDIVVVCVYDYKASQEILNNEAVAKAISGKILIQLSTGSPQEAKDALLWANKHNVEYIDGAIQVAPSQMGLPDTMILVSGNKKVLENTKEVLDVFGGSVTFIGESISAANTMDLATLSYVYGAFLGFIQGALFSEAEGLDIQQYGQILKTMSSSYGEFLAFEADVLARNDYTVMESPLSISTAATARIAEQAKNMGIDAALPSLMADLFQKADKTGFGKEEIASLIKVMQRRK